MQWVKWLLVCAYAKDLKNTDKFNFFEAIRW